MPLKGSRFTECLVRENALKTRNFKGWAFCSGMLFNSPDKWWGDHGKRSRPHEGLDLCIYRTQPHGFQRLDEKTKIPALYDGVIVKIVNDFLGRTVIVEHDFFDAADSRLVTIYGHIAPFAEIKVGERVREGRIIATLAEFGKSKANIVPHLHISLGWLSKYISYEKLDWRSIGDPNTLTLMDPLHVLCADGWAREDAVVPCMNLEKLAS